MLHRKLKKTDAAQGWDELLVGNSVYVKGAGGDTQGTSEWQHDRARARARGHMQGNTHLETVLKGVSFRPCGYEL